MKKRVLIYLAVFLVVFAVVPVAYAAQSAEAAADESREVKLEVLKHDSDEVSATSRYINDTVQLVEEDGNTYAIATLNNAAWWQSFKTQTVQPGTFDDDNFAEVEVLSEDVEANTRVVKFAVPDLAQMLNAKIHIVVTGVPEVGSYENSYDIRLKFSENSNDEEAATDTTDETDVDTTDETVSDPADETASEEGSSAAETIQDGEYTISFKVLHEQEEKESSMGRYIVTPATLTVEEGVQVITFMLTNNEQITAFQVEQDGEFVDAEVVHVDEEANTREVAFEVADLSNILNAKVQVYVAAQNYTGNHVVRLSFDPSSVEPQSREEEKEEEGSATSSFEDIDASWAASYIEALAARNIIQGVSDTRFAPEDNITRAQFAVLLSRTLELPTEAYEGIFSDVTEELAWAVHEIEAASRAGIVLGSGGHFNPGGEITREQMVTMVIRALEYHNEAVLEGIDPQVDFADAASIQDYAKSYVGYAVELGIVQGIESNGNFIFAPAEKATRAQAAKVIYEMLENF